MKALAKALHKVPTGSLRALLHRHLSGPEVERYDHRVHAYDIADRDQDDVAFCAREFALRHREQVPAGSKFLPNYGPVSQVFKVNSRR